MLNSLVFMVVAWTTQLVEPSNEEWSQWRRWSDCSVACGTGKRRKIRTCGDVARGCFGRPEEQESCNDIACPVWAQWGQWSGCSKSCGMGGRQRTRICNYGRGCDGNSVESGTCNTKKCPDCYFGDGRDYRGRVSRTRSGRNCQRWTSQSPHEHSRTPNNYPNRGLGNHNYCRNPDGEASPWCYTTDKNSRWEHCPVAKC